jgi:hypothetical protein
VEVTLSEDDGRKLPNLIEGVTARKTYFNLVAGAAMPPEKTRWQGGSVIRNHHIAKTQ